MQKVLFILFATTIIFAAVAGSFFYLYETQRVSGGFIGQGGHLGSVNLPNTESVSFLTVTATQTVTVASSFAPTTVSTAQGFSNNSIIGNSVSITSSNCQYISGQLSCQGISSAKYVAYFEQVNGSGCAYDQVIPFRINGTLIAQWEKVSSSENNRTVLQNYFQVSLQNFIQTFQNGTQFWHYSGAVNLNFSTFSLLTNQSVIIDTKALSYDFNPCFPTSLLVNPVSN